MSRLHIASLLLILLSTSYWVVAEAITPVEASPQLQGPGLPYNVQRWQAFSQTGPTSPQVVAMRGEFEVAYPHVEPCAGDLTESRSAFGATLVFDDDPQRIVGVGWTKSGENCLDGDGQALPTEPILYAACGWCGPNNTWISGQFGPVTQYRTKFAVICHPEGISTSGPWTCAFQLGSNVDTSINDMRVTNITLDPPALYYYVGASIGGNDGDAYNNDIGVNAGINLRWGDLRNFWSGAGSCGGMGQAACHGPWVPSNTTPFMSHQANLFSGWRFWDSYWSTSDGGNLQVFSDCHRTSNCQYP